MKVLSWNIQWGGQNRGGALAEAIRRDDPDVLVLTEYQPVGSAALIADLRKDWHHFMPTRPPGRRGGVAILSRHAMRRRPLSPALRPFAHRFLAVKLLDADLTIVGIYGMLEDEPYRKFWKAIIPTLARYAATPTLVMGDLNTGESLLDAPRDNFYCADYFADACKAGFRDLWRSREGRERREYSWYGRINGYRLDHALGSMPLVPHVRSCAYRHDVRERKVSDHSAMIVECELPVATRASAPESPRAASTRARTTRPR